MTTCRDIVTDAYREIGSFANEELGESEERIGMRRLNALMDDLAGLGVGETLRDLDLAKDHLPQADCTPKNIRILVTAGARPLAFPVEPENGSRFAVVDVNGVFATTPVTIARNGRKVEGQAADLVANTAGFNRTWMYRADLADWRRVSELQPNDGFPLLRECEDAFTVLLAKRLSPTDGVALSAETVSAIQRAESSLRARHRQTRLVCAPSTLLRRGRQAWPQAGMFR